MTKNCSNNTTARENASISTIEADSLTGILFGVEGIRNTIVLLNGPMGCKFYHSTTSQFLMDRPPLYLPISEGGKKVEVSYQYMNDYFFRQSRVPCTYLDHYDYVYGTSEKVEAALRYIGENVDFDLLTIVNSPGASLIGDNLKELSDKVLLGRRIVHIESPGYSDGFADGYERASLEVLKQLKPVLHEKENKTPLHKEENQSPLHKKKNAISAKNKKKTVNLLGLSIWHRYAAGDREELVRLLSMCGIEVNCSLFSGCSLEEIQAIPEADLNLVIHPDLALDTAKYLEETYGIPAYICPGPPIGFEATEELFIELARLLDVDVSPVLEESRRSRGLAWYKINGIYQSYGLPKGVTFAISDTLPYVYSLTRFLTDYLGMIPECLQLSEEYPDFLLQKLHRHLETLQAENSLQQPLYDTHAELVFGNANIISALTTRNDAFCGIEISLPGMGYTDLLPKTQIGLTGTLFLIEQILNGLMSKL